MTMQTDRKSTRLNSSHLVISYAVFCLKKLILRTSEPQLSRVKRGRPPFPCLWERVVFFNDTAVPEIYTLSLHDALPISSRQMLDCPRQDDTVLRFLLMAYTSQRFRRSEEHTSELQSPCNLVCRLLLEKKKKKKTENSNSTHSHTHTDGT